LVNGLLKSTYSELFENHNRIEVWDFKKGQSMGPILSALDVVGDGSIWALYSPGHTPGSTAYLANTTDGPKLFVGDTSHTWWGWEHSVEPGDYTEDHERNAESLRRLRALVHEYPMIEVFVGHEMDGEGSGVP